MPLDSTFTLGPFTVDDTGRLWPSDPANFPSFSVAWRGRTVEVRMAQPQDNAAAPGTVGALELNILLGRVPSTAEDPGGRPEQRDAAFALLRALPPFLPKDWRLALLADHRIALETSTCLDTPTTATELVTVVTLFLLDLLPYLDLLEESGIG